ncbi:hypothetical protein MHC_03600 [Mycoplasma haemocanis str. Illinois]|uniref:Uncharacterized protein n=1 Tax=Mycoplasma haemocanis (strain Illinois) TaxID=1111676 RepID=H6N7F8_MYCHN|nr:hypothetical protein [Mycoplasma haemocanis]AEW45580.1 hypothetical protein MHC_03600 [Mycoplasma haemocanis str. Illinois]
MGKSLFVFGSSVGVVGSAGAAGFVYWRSTLGTNVSLKDRFNREVKGRILLDVDGTKHDDVWDALVEEYKADHPNRQDIEGISKSDIDKTKLKLRCKENSDLKEESKFKSYVEWCSRNTLQTQFNAKGSGKTWITSTVESDWDSKKNSYPENNNDKLQLPQTGSTTIAKNQVTSKNIMDWCFTKVNTPFIKEANEDYKRAEAMCVA